jgi:hypothetical protein
VSSCIVPCGTNPFFHLGHRGSENRWCLVHHAHSHSRRIAHLQNSSTGVRTDPTTPKPQNPARPRCLVGWLTQKTLQQRCTPRSHPARWGLA